MNETRHIDVVASWESLCDTYRDLMFTDSLSDAERLEEFRWVVQQMNSFLSKTRTRMLSCKDWESMIDLMHDIYTPSGKVELGTRKALVYQKLRQQWIKMTIARIATMMDMKEDQDGWDD